MSVPGPLALRHGVDLRHLPIALRPADRQVVRAFLVTGEGEYEVTGLDVPASLVPLAIGVRETPGWPHTPPSRCGFEVRSRAGAKLGSMTLEPERRIVLGGVPIALFRPSRARTECVGRVERAWRYLLSWRAARRRRLAPGIRMSPPDLRALDVYYQRPRPVWIVTVPHDTGFNMFPMDLVDTLDGPDRLFLCLRTTSPSVPFMRHGPGLALAAVGAALKPAIYALGGHHRDPYSPDKPLPFRTARSASLGLEVPEVAFHVTEWKVRDAMEIGSHTCFVADRINETIAGPGEPLAHVSGLLAQRARAAGAPFSEA